MNLEKLDLIIEDLEYVWKEVVLTVEGAYYVYDKEFAENHFNGFFEKIANALLKQ